MPTYARSSANLRIRTADVQPYLQWITKSAKACDCTPVRDENLRMCSLRINVWFPI